MNNEKLVQFVQELVQRPSLSGEEGAAAARVRQEMLALGFDSVREDEYGSVVGVIEGAQPGKTLLFDGHTDTVGVTSGVPWRHDPFSGLVEDGLFTTRQRGYERRAGCVHLRAALSTGKR